jgi:hypothetical protein
MTNPCCAPEQQATCCEPSAKAECCGHGAECGCDVGNAERAHDVRERYAGALMLLPVLPNNESDRKRPENSYIVEESRLL